jgi:hypothetical protein
MANPTRKGQDFWKPLETEKWPWFFLTQNRFNLIKFQSI